MTGSHKKIVILVVLAIVWGGLALQHWFSMVEPARVPLTNVSGRASVQQTPGAAVDGLHVQLGLLSSPRTQRDMTFATPRNIFVPPTFGEMGAPDAEMMVDVSQQQKAILADLAQFHYLGFVRTEEEHEKKRDLAVLTRNDDLHVVRKGETIDHRVLVEAITQESVTLQDRDSQVEYTVLLSEEPVSQP